MLAARADDVVAVDTSGVVPAPASTMLRHHSSTTRSSNASSVSGCPNAHAAGTLFRSDPHWSLVF